jgi:hypothetical protein
MITVIILQCLLVILLFLIYSKIHNLENNSINNFNFEETLGNEENVISDESKIQIYKDGIQQNWIFVNICLFKMWNELDILDFESLQNKLRKNLEELSLNKEEMDLWAQKFNDYIKENHEF